jgi:hypothetical protein
LQAYETLFKYQMSAIERKGCAALFWTLENIFPPGDNGDKNSGLAFQWYWVTTGLSPDRL